jgi:hypothetical protein
VGTQAGPRSAPRERFKKNSLFRYVKFGYVRKKEGIVLGLRNFSESQSEILDYTLHNPYLFLLF